MVDSQLFYGEIMELILKIASIGIVAAIVCQILNKAGKEELSLLASLAGLIIVLLIILDQIKELFDTVKTLFSF